MKAKLTKTLVEGIIPGEVPVIVWDTEVNGLAIKVAPTGRRSYFLYYRTSTGKQRRPTIGRHGAITVELARQTARHWLAKIVLGGDVSASRQESRKAETVAELAERYLTEYAIPHKKARSVESDRSNLNNHVLPLIGSMRVNEVTRQDIDRVKVAVREGKTARRLAAKPRGRRIVRGGEGVANRVLALLSKMFACAEDWGLRKENPVRGVKKYKETRKDRFLGADEIRRLLEVLDEVDRIGTESPQATAAVRLLLYTGMRYGEVMTLTWPSVDTAGRCLRLADTKTGRRAIPLSDQAMAAINELPRTDPRGYVFSGTSGTPIALRRCWYRIRSLAGIDKTANLHSLRHTFASWSVMDGLSLAQVGALLGHKSAQTTLRYADHAMEALRAYAQRTGNAMAALSNSDLD